eukprot:3205134-Alexandrium_andersonii.AAC.1
MPESARHCPKAPETARKYPKLLGATSGSIENRWKQHRPLVAGRLSPSERGWLQLPGSEVMQQLAPQRVGISNTPAGP